MNLMIFLAGVFLFTFIIGILLEKIRIPWIFSALFIGVGLSVYNPFKEITNSNSFSFLAQLGMYFLLFIIGFELDLKKTFSQGSFIIRAVITIISLETILGSFLIHYIFNISWLVSILVATSFATVGEAVLLPILDEYKLIRTKLGQTILGIGVMDDLVEIMTIIFASILIGRSGGHTYFNIWTNLLILAGLFSLTFLLIKFHKIFNGKTPFKFKDIYSLFLFTIFLMFLFMGIGSIVDSTALGAILAGISLKTVIPKNKLKLIDSEVKSMCYGFFAPLFFLWVGIDTNIDYLLKYPLLILLIILMTSFAKITGSCLVGKKPLGLKKSVFMGVSLSVKFSTSIVIIKLLFENNIIPSSLYSVLVGATSLFLVIIPPLLVFLIKRWNITTSNWR